MGSFSSKGGWDAGRRTGCKDTSSSRRIIKEALLLLGRGRMELGQTREASGLVKSFISLFCELDTTPGRVREPNL